MSKMIVMGADKSTDAKRAEAIDFGRHMQAKDLGFPVQLITISTLPTSHISNHPCKSAPDCPHADLRHCAPLPTAPPDGEGCCGGLCWNEAKGMLIMT